MTIIIFFIPLGIVILPWILIIIYSQRKAGERKKIYEKILKSRKFISQGRWYPIRYCSEERFPKFWKFFPWEAAGILYLGKEKVVFLGESSSKRNIELEFNIRNSNVNWLGKKINNGGLSWLLITFQGKKHYFTSETGTTIIGSKFKTKQIFTTLGDISRPGNPNSR
ncbi:MAG: hypothetical protein MUC62_03440 [Candidatus Thermoplasmatota archaeon]|jgi:hypothetical protein|nr:hypothetical protein [Candidatus Thermoplasmatota archaeon]